MTFLSRTFARVAATGAALAASTSLAMAQVPTAVIPQAPTGSVGSAGDIEIQDIIAFAASWLISIAGGIAVLFLVIGGVVYISAGGSDEKVQKAKKYMQNAIVGLVVVLLAFVIVSNTLKITYSVGGTNTSGGAVTVSFTPPVVALSNIGQTANAAFVCTATCPTMTASSSNQAVVVTGGVSIAGTGGTVQVTRSGTGTATVTLTNSATGAIAAALVVN